MHLRKPGENPEQIFEDFIKDDGFLQLLEVEHAGWFLHRLREKGYWIHLLTARPGDNLDCFYATYKWLSDNLIPYDDISFSCEKFRWCAQSKYYDSGAIKFAIDDSPKHAMEYARHGIPVKVPVKSYNSDIEHENIEFYSSFNDILKKLDYNKL